MKSAAVLSGISSVKHITLLSVTLSHPLVLLLGWSVIWLLFTCQTHEAPAPVSEQTSYVRDAAFFPLRFPGFIVVFFIVL